MDEQGGAGGVDGSASARRRGARDRFLELVCRMLATLFFRSVEAAGDRPPPGPVILAASHLNGVVDPVLMVARLGRLPRFLAKATLWDTVPARPFLRLARLIPVHRRVDAADGTTDNRAMFAAAVDALARGDQVALFPEGTTHDDPSIRPLRTGAARIALAAAAAGLDPVTIVPVGVSYQDKVAVRGRAVVAFGEPITVTTATGDPDDAEAVRALTAELDRRIRDVTPDFASLTDALALTTAARMAGGRGEERRPPSHAEELELAKRMARRDRATVDAVVGAVARYALLLDSVRLSDTDVVARTGVRDLARRTVGLALLIVVLAPFAAAGLVANAVPALLVLVAGLLPSAPVSKGTVRVLVAMAAFPLTWLAIATLDAGDGALAELARSATLPVEPVLHVTFGTRGGWGAGVLAFLSMPLLGAAALVLVERCAAFLRDLVAWRTLVDRRGQLPAVRQARQEVVDLARTAAEAP